MNEKRITSRDVYYLIRRPSAYRIEDDENTDISRVVKCYHPDVRRYLNKDKKPYFLINTSFISNNISGINCKFFYRKHRWILTDFGNCNFVFKANTMDNKIKSSDLLHFHQFAKDTADDFDIKYDKRAQEFYLPFKNLRSLQKAFYSMINFQIMYTSVIGFIA